MCGLFGFSYYGKEALPKGVDVLLTALAKASAVRGTDATGIAYNLEKKLEIDKAPKDAHSFKYSFPDSHVVMGHTRKTTQGQHKKNYNNHPFRGKCGQTMFALAHNGMLYNDRQLKIDYNLPTSQIETDSYVAVQLLERYGKLTINTLKLMAEDVEGMFTFSVLDEDDNLYFVKHNNPLVIAHIPKLSLYVYASTSSILLEAMLKSPLTEPFIVNTFTEGKIGMTMTFPKAGSITVIHPHGGITEAEFTPSERTPLTSKYTYSSSYLVDDAYYRWNDYDEYTGYRGKQGRKSLSGTKIPSLGISSDTGAIGDWPLTPKKGGK